MVVANGSYDVLVERRQRRKELHAFINVRFDDFHLLIRQTARLLQYVCVDGIDFPDIM